MIVKNEAHLIIQTLQHLAKFIKFDYWAINDNGSTDGTQDLIRGYFKEQGIPGVLDETPWRDFAFNRTVAFNAAFDKTDYAFVWDADDEIYGDFRLPENLTADSYLFTYGNAGGTRYSRCQLFNNRLRWKYVGVLHEYPASADGSAKTQETVMGDYYFISGRTGARNKDPEKYLKDALILEKAFKEEYEAKGPLYNRYAFYTAQSYNSCNKHAKAIEFYKKVVDFDTSWDQERYMSCIEIYDQYAAMKHEEEGLRFLVEAHRFDPRRIEHIYRLVKYYCIKGMSDVAVAYYTLIEKYYENDYPTDNIANRLFAKKDEYDFYLPYYMIISCERSKRMDIFKKMYEIIFRQKYLYTGAWWVHNLFHNLQFGIPSGDATFVEGMLTYVELLRGKGIDFTTAHYDVMDRVIKANRPALSLPATVKPVKKQTSPVRVMLSVTTCKRLPLFKETMNSMMRCWKDLATVDYFFCVDDNSSAEDRAVMQAEYPFFDYYMKGPNEKGHRESMNIIWNKLREVQPTYWVHMEDDWLYFKQENYVTRAIAFLEKYESQGIHQLVFNREYGLMMNDMKRTSFEPLESGAVLHSQKEVQGPNCAYWPHYSIQPSVIRAAKILELGNYDSPNTFFERDYANKYGAAGYNTMFFDGIYSLHIGKQHWEKEGMNAYALNAVGQFSQKKEETPEKPGIPGIPGIPETKEKAENQEKPENTNEIPQLIITEILKNEPLCGSMAEHLEQIIQKIAAAHPFGLIRPSDGEHKVLTNTTLTNCDNWTFTANGGLRQQLLDAIQAADPNLYIGIPCNSCQHPWNCTDRIYKDYTETWAVPAGQRTYANVFGNSNWERWTEFLKSYTKGLYVVTSGSRPTTGLTIKERFIIDEKLVDRWDTAGTAETERLLKFIADKQGELICFSAGPLSKVWVPMCMKANPTNMYVDVGASIDVFTKGATNRMYTAPGKFADDLCWFRPTTANKNLIYMCVFNEAKYVDLLKILMLTIKFFTKTDGIDFLVITNAGLAPAIRMIFKQLQLPLAIKLYEPRDLHESLCARYTVFDYEGIAAYERILYLDTDIIVQGDLTPLFTTDIEDKIHAVPEGTIEHAYHGGHLFDLSTVNKDTPGMNSGILLFVAINAHIQRLKDNGEHIGIIVDQAFLNFHTVSAGRNETQLLTKYALIYAMEPPPPPSAPTDVVLCHFVWPIGNAHDKIRRMIAHMKHVFENYGAIYNVAGPTEPPLIGKKFRWEAIGHITFEPAALRTKWTPSGTYKWLDDHTVEASWHGFEHVLRMNNAYTSFVSIRKRDFDCVVGTLWS